MMDDYVTKAELEAFGKELIEELKHCEIELKERRTGQLLKPVYNKWFHDTTASAGDNLRRPFKKHLEIPYVWRLWEACRAATCAVCSSKTVAGIRDEEMALDFCEKLCRFISGYLTENETGVREGK